MRHARRALRIVMVTAAFAGCGGPIEAPEGTLRLALRTAPNRLDPAFAVDVAEGELCSMLFQGLVRFSPEGELIPDAARAWTVEQGGARYVFHMDLRARFGDGRRLVSADVLYSFRRILSPETASPRRWVLDRIRGADAFAAGESGTIAGLSAPDDSTVVIELDAPFQPFLSMLAMPAGLIVAGEALADGQFIGLPSGSGQWRLDVWERGDYLSLAPNPNHPSPVTGLRAIRFRIIPEAFTRIAEYESGALDILEIPPVELSRFRNDESHAPRIQSRAELRVYYIGLNNRTFTDPRVRRALNMAVNVDRLIEVLAGGVGDRATGSVPPGLAGHEGRPAWPYDPEAARALLAEAGYAEGLSMEIWQRESPEGNRLLEAIQGYLRAVNVDVTLVRREWSAFKQAVNAGRVDAFFLDWFADYPDAENFLYPLFHSENQGGGGNRALFSDADVDRLIEQAAAAADPAVAAALYARVDSLVYTQAPWIYLYFPRSFHAVSGRVSGYQLPSLYLGSDYSSVTLVDTP